MSNLDLPWASRSDAVDGFNHYPASWSEAFNERPLSDQPDKPVSKLCNEARQLLNQPTTAEYHILHKNFESIDEDADGFLSITDIGLSISDTIADLKQRDLLPSGEVVRRLDVNSDGYISEEEAPGVREAWTRADFLVDLYGKRDRQFELKGLYDDGQLNGKGISIKDIDALGASEVEENRRNALLYAVGFLRNFFHKIDHNSDGYISKEDINRLINEPALRQRERAALLAIRDRFDEASSSSNDEWGRELTGITEADVEKFHLKLQTVS